MLYKVTVVYLYSVYSRGCILIGRCLGVKEGYKRSGSSTGTQEQSAHNEQKHRHSKQKKALKRGVVKLCTIGHLSAWNGNILIGVGAIDSALGGAGPLEVVSSGSEQMFRHA